MTNKEAIDHIKLILLRDRDNELHFVSHDEEIALDLAINALEERSTGEWEKDEEGYYRCSKCKIIYKKMPLDRNDKPRLVSCAWCGAKMKG